MQQGCKALPDQRELHVRTAADRPSTRTDHTGNTVGGTPAEDQHAHDWHLNMSGVEAIAVGGQGFCGRKRGFEATKLGKDLGARSFSNAETASACARCKVYSAADPGPELVGPGSLILWIGRQLERLYSEELPVKFSLFGFVLTDLTGIKFSAATATCYRPKVCCSFQRCIGS